MRMPKVHTLLFMICFSCSLHAQKFISLYEKGSYEKCLEACKKATDKDKKNLDAYLYKSLSYLQLSKHTTDGNVNPYKTEQALFVLDLLQEKNNGTAFLAQHEQEYNFIVNTALEITQQLIEENMKYAEKLLTALLKLEQRPEFYYASAKIKMQDGNTHEGLEEMNLAASEIYKNYYNGDIQKPYMPELFLDLAAGMAEEGDIQSACVMYMRTIRMFRSEESVTAMYQALEGYALSQMYFQKEGYEIVLCYADSLAQFIQQPDKVNSLKWQLIKNCYDNLFPAENYSEAKSFLTDKVCGKKEFADTAFNYLQSGILQNMQTGTLNNKDFVTVDYQQVNILTSLLSCNNIQTAEYAEKQIKDALNNLQVEPAAKLYFIFKDDITDKKSTNELKKLFKEKTAEVYARDSDYVSCRSIALLVNDKSLYEILSTQAMKMTEDLIAQKKFNEAGKTIRNELVKNPNSSQWKYLYKKWVIEDYKQSYLPSTTGYDIFTVEPDKENCVAGKLKPESQKQFAQCLNYVRRIAGIYTPCRLDEKYNTSAQEAAFMMLANNSLSHNTPDTWTCYTKAGSQGASHSNLSYGAMGSGALMGQLDDYGSNNQSVGHRRWILNPFNTVFGHGSTDETMALYVFGTDGYTEQLYEEYHNTVITWPPAGYCPSSFQSNRWSISLDDAIFENATVTVTHEGKSQTLTLLPPDYGYGMNTLVWEMKSLPTLFFDETTYVVSVKNVFVGYNDKEPKSYTYSITFLPMDTFSN